MKVHSLDSEPKGAGGRRKTWSNLVDSTENLSKNRIDHNQNVTVMHRHAHSGSAYHLGQLSSAPPLASQPWNASVSNVSEITQQGQYPVQSQSFPIHANIVRMPAVGGGSYPPSEAMEPLPAVSYRPGDSRPRKRNRLQEWKASCCRPLPLIICGVLMLLIIAAIIAIAVTQSAAQEQRRFDSNGQPMSSLGTNQQQTGQLQPGQQQNQQQQQPNTQSGYTQPYGTQQGSQQQYGVQNGQGTQSNGVNTPYGSAVQQGVNSGILPEQVSAGQSSPGGRVGNGMNNVGQGSMNNNNNLQNGQQSYGGFGYGQSNGQQSNNMQQNGQQQQNGYGSGGVATNGSQGGWQGLQQYPQAGSTNGVGSQQYGQNGQNTQQQNTGDRTGYAPNVATNNGGAPNGGTGSNRLMASYGGQSVQSQTLSSGYVPNIAQQQQQQQQQPSNQFYGTGRR